MSMPLQAVPDQPTPLAIARSLDAEGLRTIPLKPGTKVPMLRAWKKYQREPTSAHLPRWFKDDHLWEPLQDPNYGVITGLASGWVVLDIDSNEARLHWRELLGGSTLDSLPVTHTANGGLHYWLAIDEPTTCWRQSAEEEEAGIKYDVKGDGGYVAVPPSRFRP